MTVSVVLDVRFRAFGITFGRVHQEWREPVPFAAPTAAIPLIRFDRRGISLQVDLR